MTQKPQNLKERCSQQIAAAKFARQALDEAREHGGMFVDAPSRKIAVYSNSSGSVTLAIEDDGLLAVTAITHDEIAEFVQAVVHAGIAAAETMGSIFADCPDELQSREVSE